MSISACEGILRFVVVPILAVALGVQDALVADDSTSGNAILTAALPEVDFSSLPTVDSQGHVEPNTGIERSNQRPILRVAFLGDTLVHRMSEFGYLETELTRLLVDIPIVFRNLGWPGDSVYGDARTGFGPTEANRSNWRRPGNEFGDYGRRKMLDQIRRAAPHVVFIAFGSNVVYEDERGLARFEKGLKELLDLLEPTGVQVCLLSQPPREVDALFPGNLQQQNERLAVLSSTLKEIGRQRQLPVVDLFGPWPAASDNRQQRFTENGIQLNATGYQILATLVAEQLQLTSDPWRLAVDAENSDLQSSGGSASGLVRTEFGMRWRVSDARLPSVAVLRSTGEGEKAARQMRIENLSPGTYLLDIDGRRAARSSAFEWKKGVAVARGPDVDQLEALRQAVLQKNRLFFYGFRPQNKAYIHLFRRHERGHHEAELERFALLVQRAEEEIDRLRRPRQRIYEIVRETDYPDHEVPGARPEPDIAKELASFTVPDGFEINLFASDPMIANPININWDEHGRMWVATSTTYPHLHPGEAPNDKIIVLEDVDRDGRADLSTVFADGLLVPQSVIPAHRGAYVTQSTDLLLLSDTNGDGKADEKRVLLTGFGNADVHHMIHGLRWGPGGDLFFTQSIYINSTVETPWGIRRSHGSCIWRLRPETLRLESLSRGLVNPWGFAFDRWGQSFATDGAGGSGPAYIFPGSAYPTHNDFPRELQSLNPGRPKECGLDIVSGRHLPVDWQGTLVSNDFRANRVTQYRLTESGSGYTSEYLGDIVASSHRAFRPVDVKVGPDGSLYIVDWYSLVIDHGEVDFHHPLRDTGHGRIWRLTKKSAPLVEPPDLANASIGELLEALESTEQWTRDQARRLLREADADQVYGVVRGWERRLDETDDNFAQHQLNALWVCQGIRHVDEDLLGRVLDSRDHHCRAAAVRVLADWHDEVAKSHYWFADAVADDHPQVRLEAVNALREVGTREAIELAMQVLARPLDEYLDFALWRTVRDLQDQWLPAFESGQQVFGGKPQQIAYALAAVGGRASLAPLAELARSEQLDRKQRQNVLTTLAAVGGVTEHMVVLEEIASLDETAQASVMQAMLISPQNAIPSNAMQVLQLVDSDSRDVRLAAVRLAGEWKLEAAVVTLLQRFEAMDTSLEERLAAGTALVNINPSLARESLTRVVDRSPDDEVKTAAISSLVSIDENAAARFAAKWLSETDDAELAETVFSAFLLRQSGPRDLAQNLGNATLSKDVANRGAYLARQSGRPLEEFILAVLRAGGLSADNDEEGSIDIQAILRDVPTKGDPHRGEAVYHMSQLRCTQCHAIGGAGGKVGPDLSSLGGSASVADILQSLLQPSDKIKQGYQTTQMITVNGRIHTGVVEQQTDVSVTLRDANDERITIPIDDIDEIIPSELSMMPIGLAEPLNRQQLVDLTRFLSTLGREPDFTVPPKQLVRKWYVLAEGGDAEQLSPQELQKLDGDASKWSTHYSRVDGKLPLGAIAGGGSQSTSDAVILKVEAAGEGKLQISTNARVQVLQDSGWRLTESGAVAVAFGQPTIILRIESPKQSDLLTVEWIGK